MNCSFFGFQLLKIVEEIVSCIIFKLKTAIYDIKKFVCEYQVKKDGIME